MISWNHEEIKGKLRKKIKTEREDLKTGELKRLLKRLTGVEMRLKDPHKIMVSYFFLNHLFHLSILSLSGLLIGLNKT